MENNKYLPLQLLENLLSYKHADLSETQKNEIAIADCLYALGLAYNNSDDIENATVYLKKAIKNYK